MGQGMKPRMSETERQLIYLSLIVIVVIAILMQYGLEETYSLLALFFIIVIAIGNIVYIYNRSRRKEPGSLLRERISSLPKRLNPSLKRATSTTSKTAISSSITNGPRTRRPET